MYLDLSKYSFLIAVQVQMCEQLFECGSCTALQNYSLFSPSIFLSFSFPSLLINVWNKLLGDSGGCFWHILPSSHNLHQQAATLSKESWSCALFFHSLPHRITWCAWILGGGCIRFCWNVTGFLLSILQEILSSLPPPYPSPVGGTRPNNLEISPFWWKSLNKARPTIVCFFHSW